MWTHLGTITRRMVVALLLAGSLGTAAFAFNATVRAEGSRCCLWITQCDGGDCSAKDTCGANGFCCSGCD